MFLSVLVIKTLPSLKLFMLNDNRRNEEVDDKTLIQQLKKRIAELEASMACMKLLQVCGGRFDSDYFYVYVHAKL